MQTQCIQNLFMLPKSNVREQCAFQRQFYIQFQVTACLFTAFSISVQIKYTQQHSTHLRYYVSFGRQYISEKLIHAQTLFTQDKKHMRRIVKPRRFLYVFKSQSKFTLVKYCLLNAQAQAYRVFESFFLRFQWVVENYLTVNSNV